MNENLLWDFVNRFKLTEERIHELADRLILIIQSKNTEKKNEDK